MPRTAKIYARLQSQKSGSARHIKYLLDGHGTDSTKVEFWTKGIPKKLVTPQDLPKVWAKIDRRWKQEKNSGGNVAKQSKVKYMQSLIALPNSITDVERHSLAKQILRLFPQQHPVTVVAHEYGTSRLPNKHLHIAFSYRKCGYGKVDREFQQGFEKNLKKLLKKQYRKYGFQIKENEEKYQVKYKPQNLMRILLKKYGRERMKNPTFLSRVVLRESMAEVERCRRKVSEDDSDVNMANLVAAEKSVAWLSLEISKAESLKHTSKSTRQPLGVDISVLENQGLSPMSGSNSKRFGR